MEQFGANPLDKWKLITRMINECDAYLLIIAGRYGTLADNGISWTEKEYNYAKEKGIPVIALIRTKESISGDKLDNDQTKLDAFRKRVKDESFNSGFFSNEGELKYEAGRGLHNMKEYLRDTRAGWVRYSDVKNIINNDRKQFTIDYAVMVDALSKALTAVGNEVRGINESRRSGVWKITEPISDNEVKDLFE